MILAAFSLLVPLAQATPAQEPGALTKLSHLVQSLVEEEEIVGAELLVIQDGKPILHEAYGWRDRESELPMATGSVFCVRSMTKPLIGASILMLAEEGLLGLDDKISQYLPYFDEDTTRDITIEQLLQHTSGLPMSLIMNRNLTDLDGIQAVAQLGGGYALSFTPGSAFQYSDQGTDTLTALIEVVSGVPAADFVQKRLLDPLGMRDTATVMSKDHALRERGCSKYLGTRSHWTRFWSTDQPPLFQFFLGSQGLYSTLPDYARFLDLYLQGGKIGEKQLLGAPLVRKTLTPGPFPLGSPTGLPGLRTDYGCLMQLWTGPVQEGDGRELVAFGHTGSDGTHAWAFPKQNAMALYFTQSRGTLSGLRVEAALGELFLGVPVVAAPTAPPLEPFLGYYWENSDDDYRAIVRDGESLALEVPGRAVLALTYAGGDRWTVQQEAEALVFDRAESGEVTGFHMGDHKEFRFVPSADLPGADAVAARVLAAHRLDLLATIGPVRLSYDVALVTLNMKGTAKTLCAWPDRTRTDSVFGEEFAHDAFDGRIARTVSRSKPLTIAEGQIAEQMRVDHDLARFGDWKRWHPRLYVIQQLVRGGKTLLLVRAGDTSAPARTFFVDADTGRVLGEDNVLLVEGMGLLGQRLRFDDFRDIGGMTLPYSIKARLSNPMIGSIETTLTGFELGVEVPEGFFELKN
jgi:CubicO group peptidase (beta-lactamase class C family)